MAIDYAMAKLAIHVVYARTYGMHAVLLQLS